MKICPHRRRPTNELRCRRHRASFGAFVLPETGAGVVEWQTRMFEGHVPQGVGVQVSSPAPNLVRPSRLRHACEDRHAFQFLSGLPGFNRVLREFQTLRVILNPSRHLKCDGSI